MARARGRSFACHAAISSPAAASGLGSRTVGGAGRVVVVERRVVLVLGALVLLLAEVDAGSASSDPPPHAAANNKAPAVTAMPRLRTHAARREWNCRCCTSAPAARTTPRA